MGSSACRRSPYFRFAHGEAEVLDDVVDAIVWDEQQQQQPGCWVSFAHGPAEVFAEAVPFRLPLHDPASISTEHCHSTVVLHCVGARFGVGGHLRVSSLVSPTAAIGHVTGSRATAEPHRLRGYAVQRR